MTEHIETAGRIDLAGFFEQSGALTATRLPHFPFLAFVGCEPVTVTICESAAKLITLPDETPVMVQWPGKWRSDFFRMTVGDVREALNHGGSR